MSSQITCSFKIESWDETPFSKSEDGPKLTKASVIQSYSGELEANSTIEYLMTTFKDGTSKFMGIEEIIGMLDGRSGSFLVTHKGKHEEGVASSDFKIIPNSGTGELLGIRGNGSYEATHENAEFELEYIFEE